MYVRDYSCMISAYLSYNFVLTANIFFSLSEVLLSLSLT